MHESSYAKMREFVSRYLAGKGDTPLCIVDIGARSVLGHQTYRDLFSNASWKFTGLDIEPGHNVDIVVEDSYAWREIEAASFDIAISGQALEHVEFPWKTLGEVFRILKPGGLFCLIVPSSGEEHRYPVDCWRFYPDSMHALGRDAGFSIVEVFTDFGLGNWQDTFAVFQKPFYGLDSSVTGAPFPVMEDRSAAFAEYFKALSTRPRNPAYYLNLGALLRQRGLSEDADLAYRIGSELFPNHPTIRREVIMTLLRAGEVVAAAEHCMTLLGLRPIVPENIEAVGAVFAELSEDRCSYYGKLLPVELPPLKRIAGLAHDSGWYRLAASCWQRLAALEPEEQNHHAMYCLALWGEGKREASLASFFRLRDKDIAAGEITRTAVLQRFIDATGANRYLEIGVERGINFLQIRAGSKFAVDPEFKIPGGARDFDGHHFFEMASDAFFASPPQELVESGIDVALVDGLHTYEQALRDVENCLRYLRPGGLVVMHDCLPASAAEAAPTMEAARATPGFRNAWTGDVYKAVIHLRAMRPDLFVAVLDADHGIGIVTKGAPERVLDMSPEQIAKLSFTNLKAAAGHLLNLKPASWFEVWLAERSASPT